MSIQLCRRGQLDENDVIVDGDGIVLLMLKNLPIESHLKVMVSVKQDSSVFHKKKNNNNQTTTQNHFMIVMNKWVLLHLGNLHGLDELSIGRAIMLSKDHAMISPK